MAIFQTRAFALWLGAFAFAFLVPAAAHAAKPGDAQAQKALVEAIDKDFLETRFDDAEKRLRAAAEKCGADQCTPLVKAKLYAGIGTVLAAGKKQITDAKDAFVEALNIDKSVQPNPDIASTEAEFAFDMAKKQLKIGSAHPAKPPPPVEPVEPKPPLRPEKSEEPTQCGEGGGRCRYGFDCVGGTCRPGAAPEKPKDEPRGEARKNWFTITFVPDVSLLGADDVCTASSQKDQSFHCVRQDKTHYVGTPALGQADNVTTGLALSTMRVIVGYDRIILDNIGLGARVGYAFNGVTDGGANFIPLHLEARASYTIGKTPFAGTGVRPTVFLSAGLAEVDTRFDVEVLEEKNACGPIEPGTNRCTRASSDNHREEKTQKLAAYKRAGPGFAGGGFNLAVSPAPSAAIVLGVRMNVTFPVVTPVISPEVGFSLGF